MDRDTIARWRQTARRARTCGADPVELFTFVHSSHCASRQCLEPETLTSRKLSGSNRMVMHPVHPWKLSQDNELAPQAGFEPATLRLIWLRPADLLPSRTGRVGFVDTGSNSRSLAIEFSYQITPNAPERGYSFGYSLPGYLPRLRRHSQALSTVSVLPARRQSGSPHTWSKTDTLAESSEHRSTDQDQARGLTSSTQRATPGARASRPSHVSTLPSSTSASDVNGASTA
jgi:hypothetical protein